MGYNEILFDIHEVVYVDASKFGELLSTFFKKGGNAVSFLDLFNGRQ